ncbi:uncharacterized protein LOC124817940 [Hydra vulgaris]|uniref:uncharacterized protein LOC124817940 n=1 Tax=Hydra vulgaris TaxID=6087 RepID=UPI001F5F8C89|nr:uncharacterized protein LOC124817940 [Hydra vulgaris]
MLKWSKQRQYSVGSASLFEMQNVERKFSRRKTKSYFEQQSEERNNGNAENNGDAEFNNSLLNKNFSCEGLGVFTTSNKKFYYYIKSTKSSKNSFKQSQNKTCVCTNDSVDSKKKANSSSETYLPIKKKEKLQKRPRLSKTRKKNLVDRQHSLSNRCSTSLRESNMTSPKYRIQNEAMDNKELNSENLFYTDISLNFLSNEQLVQLKKQMTTFNKQSMQVKKQPALSRSPILPTKQMTLSNQKSRPLNLRYAKKFLIRRDHVLVINDKKNTLKDHFFNQKCSVKENNIPINGKVTKSQSFAVKDCSTQKNDETSKTFGKLDHLNGIYTNKNNLNEKIKSNPLLFIKSRIFKL